MSTVLIVLLFFLNALLMPLVVELVKERASGLALRVMTLAVRLLPRVHRDRYRQEWTAELEEMERQNVSQLVSSLRILLSAPSMGWVLRFRNREVTELFQAVEASALPTDAVIQLVRNCTQITPTSPPLFYEFAQLQINRMSQFLKELSEGGEVTYDGEDRDWMLGLTMQSQRTIDATSLSTVDAGGSGFDGGLWTSDLGHRYLELQREAIHRGVVIRRVFILDSSGQTREEDFLRIYRQQRDLGIHTKVLDRSRIPPALKNLLFDFIVFDGVISYESTPAARVEDTMKPTIVKTNLALQPQRVKNRMRRFEDLWSTASDPNPRVAR